MFSVIHTGDDKMYSSVQTCMLCTVTIHSYSYVTVLHTPSTSIKVINLY